MKPIKKKIIYKETWAKTIIEFDAIRRCWISQPKSMSLNEAKELAFVERRIAIDDLNGFIKALKKAKKLLSHNYRKKQGSQKHSKK